MNELCLVCGEKPCWTWTDTHGVAICRCGTPYRLLHYDENKKRVEKPAECLLRPEWIETAKKYWDETHSRVDPGGFDITGFLGRDRTKSDCGKWNAWLEQHKAELPQ